MIIYFIYKNKITLKQMNTNYKYDYENEITNKNLRDNT